MSGGLDSTLFLCYAAVAVVLGVTYVKCSSIEGTTITTGEFKLFQTGFLTAHAAIFLGELLALASFYPTLVALGHDVEATAMLYITYVVSTTVFSLLLDIADFGTRKDKCVVSAGLYLVAIGSFFIDDHYSMLQFGRVIHGAACALHHSAFQSYVDYQHEVLGFPDDWLTYTYSVMTHSMAFMAGLSGVCGYFTTSMGPMGTPGLCCLIMALTAGYIIVVWEQDVASPRFMFSGFLFNFRQAVEQTKARKTVLYILGISATFESAITIFTYYWAVWLTGMVVVVDQAERRALPYELLYSSMVMATMLGNYFYGMYAPSIGPEMSFQAVLCTCSGAFLLAATVTSPMLAFALAVVVQFMVGGYWPSIGGLRGRYVLPEQRSTATNMARVITMVIACIVLYCAHDSPLLVLTTCALLCGVSAYWQHEMVSLHTEEGADFDEFEKDDE